MMNATLVRLILGALIRHALTALGGMGLATSKDTEQWLVSLGLLGLGAAWSLYQKVRAHHAQHGP